MVAFMAALAMHSTAGQDCIKELSILEMLEEAAVDYNVPREYTLCEKTIYRVQRLDHSYNGKANTGYTGIKLRPNVHIKCGDDGSSDGRCNIRDGDVQVDASNLFGVNDDLRNVTVQGLTFSRSTRYSLYANKPGNITFIDCYFQDNTKAEAPILADYFIPNSNQMLELNFIDCFFEDNRFYGKPAYPAIINANGPQNKIVVASSQFKNNDMTYNNTDKDKLSFLIETSGPLELYENCFEDNLVGVANVASWYRESPSTFGNWGGNSNGPKCGYMASYETDTQYRLNTPRCFGFESNKCQAFGTDSPSLSPSAAPTSSPSESPSASPTLTGSMGPTVSSAPSMSPSVSGAPSSSPSDHPSSTPTESPTLSAAPSAAPSSSPSASPTTTPYPTVSPTVSAAPSASPSSAPSASPSAAPTEGSGATTSAMFNVGILSISLIVVTMACM